MQLPRRGYGRRGFGRRGFGRRAVGRPKDRPWDGGEGGHEGDDAIDDGCVKVWENQTKEVEEVSLAEARNNALLGGGRPA